VKNRVKKTQIKHFTRSEEKRFRKSVEERESPWDKLMFDLLFDTGLRLSELTGINVGDVADKKYLTIVGKGMKERTIPIWSVNGLTEEIIGFLEWKRDHGEYIHPRSPLFCSKSNKIRVNKRISDRAVQYLVNRYTKEAGLERKFYPHACRHSFGFNLGRKGDPIQVIKKLMGHSKIETTSIYVEPDMDQLENALNCIS
jgi:integrase/recombinase XerC